MLLLCSSRLLRALGNDGDGASTAFPKGKQNGVFFIFQYFMDRRFSMDLKRP
jgi:hypothetical protein